MKCCKYGFAGGLSKRNYFQLWKGNIKFGLILLGVFPWIFLLSDWSDDDFKVSLVRFFKKENEHLGWPSIIGEIPENNRE